MKVLTEAGFTVSPASTTAMAKLLMAGRRKGFDVLVLDASLPDGNERKLCASLRQQGCRVPVTLLSGLGQKDDSSGGSRLGRSLPGQAFQVGELLARIRGQLRHSTMRPERDAPPRGASPTTDNASRPIKHQPAQPVEA